ncbi:MAG: FAD-dependent oxidoreductase [Butyrivibrio sp.]|jgi:protoporphyrinogen oxidase|nr:FAD-dependent oxidoreductase [Butyrivibrio sp.]
MKVNYLILGAGPAGLTFANYLMDKSGEDSFIILEKEKTAGGLCRSAEVDGSPFDIGGGHFLDVRRPKVNDYLFQFMPEDEWNKFDRDSRIVMDNNSIHHPFEANIWELDIDKQIEYLKSIAAAGCNSGVKKPEKFVDWIRWKLGDKIADDYMIPYNQKVFGENLNQLGTYWLSKLPDVSFEDTLRSCLTHHAYAKQPGHAQFYYPKKYGYGELWLRMADTLSDHIEYEKEVCGIDFNNRIVTCADSSKYQADVIITTIPWIEYRNIVGMPDDNRKLLQKLRYSSIQTEYYPQNVDTTAHWLYYPDLKISYHRILVRHNFCHGSKGYWTETNVDRVSGKNEAGIYQCHLDKHFVC